MNVGERRTGVVEDVKHRFEVPVRCRGCGATFTPTVHATLNTLGSETYWYRHGAPCNRRENLVRIDADGLDITRRLERAYEKRQEAWGEPDKLAPIEKRIAGLRTQLQRHVHNLQRKADGTPT